MEDYDDPGSIHQRLNAIENKLDSLITSRDSFVLEIKQGINVLWIVGAIVGISALVKSCT